MPQQGLAEKCCKWFHEAMIVTKTEKTPSPWAGLFESRAVSRFSLEEQALPDKINFTPHPSIAHADVKKLHFAETKDTTERVFS
jgi:hypothetical protein